MKNLMIYIHPEHRFTDGWGNEVERLAKVQIDNSLEWWKPEDIILVTNFPYEYNGIKAIELETFCPYKPTVTKIYAITELFKKGLINDVCWFHDFDAFQMQELNPDLEGCDIALTDYGIIWKGNVNNLRPSTGTIFFKPNAEDIFKTWKEENDISKNNEEVVLLLMSHKGRFKWLFDRLKKLNITYNFAIRRRNIQLTYEICDKPIKVIHFHPWDRRGLFYLNPPRDNIEAVINGNNPMKIPLITEKLINLFKKHQII